MADVRDEKEVWRQSDSRRRVRQLRDDATVLARQTHELVERATEARRIASRLLRGDTGAPSTRRVESLREFRQP